MNGHAHLNSNHNGDKGPERKPWTPSSWKDFPIKQQPEYDDPVEVEAALNKLRALPPIVHRQEIEMLKSNLARVCEGKAFLLQGGDCAERFEDCTQEAIEKKFKIMLQMSLIIIHGARVPVVRLARMAGQFAKPRSAPFETIDGVSYHSYKGDMINGFGLSERRPDPHRLVDAYFHSVATANYLRAMITGGVSDLSSAPEWRLENVLSTQVREEYEQVVQKILEALSFLSTIDAFSEATKSVHLFCSHEGMLLDYESALTYQTKDDTYYNYGAHFLWIGDRTRELDGAHMEYFRGIANPIGVKVGPSMKGDDLVKVIKLLNPDKEPGRLTLITRYGVDNIERILPEHIKAAQSTGIPVVWVSDPCHGNTEVTAEGIKTRNIEKVMAEMERAFRIHAENGSFLGGVHLELTGDDVTECIGGSCKFDNLSTKYESFCDPRLNYTQSLDVAFHIVKQLNDCVELKKKLAKKN